MERVNVLLQQEISRVLATELRDPRLASMVSVTRVESSPDLQKARVHVSVLGSEQDKRNTLKALRSASGFIHREMVGSLTLKRVPSMEFRLDESIEKGAELLKLIEDVSSGHDIRKEIEQ